MKMGGKEMSEVCTKRRQRRQRGMNAISSIVFVQAGGNALLVWGESSLSFSVRCHPVQRAHNCASKAWIFYIRQYKCSHEKRIPLKILYFD